MEVDRQPAAAEDGGEVSPPPLALPSILIEWYKIHRSAVSPPPTATLPMVSIVKNENYSEKDNPIIFPPINHENLQISPIPTHIHSDMPSFTSPMYNSCSDSDSESVTHSNSSSSFSPSESSLVSHSPRSSSPKTRPAADTARLFESWMEVLHSKVHSIIRFLWNSFASSGGFSMGTFPSAALTAVLIAFLYFRRARTAREQSRAPLVGIIKEKDEKIKQLLDQISRMNQVLLALHRIPTNPSS